MFTFTCYYIYSLPYIWFSVAFFPNTKSTLYNTDKIRYHFLIYSVHKETQHLDILELLEQFLWQTFQTCRIISLVCLWSVCPIPWLFQRYNIIFVSSYKATPKTKHKNNMWWALLAPLHLETHFVHTIPWNCVPLLFKCSPKILIMSVRRSDKQTLTFIVHTISIIKKIAKDGKSGILTPLGVKKHKSTLAAYGIANIVPHKTNTV